MAGNANSGQRKDRLFRDAIVMQLKIRDAGDDMRTLRSIADKVIEGALNGNLPEIKELSDRIDGKPAQQLDLGNADEGGFLVVQRIERTIIDPHTANPDSTSIPASTSPSPL